MAMRWRWPPENSCGIAVAPGRIEPHLLEGLRGAPVALLARDARARGPAAPRSRSRPPSCAARAIRTGPGTRPAAAAASGRMPARSSGIRLRSSKRTMPEAGWSRRIARPSVDLPEPDSPTTPTVSPARTERLTPSTARSTWLVRPNRPALELEGRPRCCARRARAGAFAGGGSLRPRGSASMSMRV